MTSRDARLSDDSERWGIGLAYAVTGTSLEVFHKDRLGSVRAVTSASGSVTATFRMDEFGLPTATTGTSAQPYRFTGEPLDQSGLLYLRSRYYDATAGRFLTRDRWHGAAAAPCSLNRYAYVLNNPTTFTDPTGLRVMNAVGAGVKCGYATGMVVGEMGYASISGTAFGTLLAGGALAPGANVVLLGVGIFSGLLAVINYEHTQQSVEYCLGLRGIPDALSTTEKVPPIRYPPGGGPAPAPPPIRVPRP